MVRSSLGDFEQQVLLAMLQLGGEAYSAPIVLRIEAAGGRPVAPAAVYIALRRLEKRGLVSSKKEDPEPNEGGRGRRVFKVEPEAVALLRTSRQTLERLWEGLDPLFHER